MAVTTSSALPFSGPFLGGGSARKYSIKNSTEFPVSYLKFGCHFQIKQ